MALSLSCPCGARFEVEDAFAGQNVACPQCQQPVAVRGLVHVGSVLTSGYAVASVVIALVLAFTGIGPLVAVLLGVIGLIHIRRHRDQVAGTGYAILGICLGVVFTLLFGLAIMQTELFGLDVVREGIMGDQVDRTGPMEVSRAADGFAIRRPTTKWGVASDKLAADLVPGSDLVLVNVSKDTYLDITTDQLAGRSLDAYKDSVLETFKEQRDPFGKRQPLQFRGLTVHKTETLPAEKDHEALEVFLEVKMGAQPLLFLVRIIRPVGSNQVYLVRAWAQKRRFPLVETEVREAMNSFRLINGGAGGR